MIRLRTSTDKDLSVLVELNVAVQRLHAELRPGGFQAPGHAALASELAAMLVSPGTRAVLAEAEGRVVGYLVVRHVVRPANAFKRERDDLLVDQLGVVPAHRRRGVGRVLMAEARRIASELGTERLELEAYRLNEDARAFYAAEGFGVFKSRWEARAEGPGSA